MKSQAGEARPDGACGWEHGGKGMKSKKVRTKVHRTWTRLDLGLSGERGGTKMLLSIPTWVTEKMMSFTETGSPWHI